MEMPKVPTLKPPSVSSSLYRYATALPSMGNLQNQYREFRQKNRKKMPTTMQTVTEASKEAMKSIRGIDGRSREKSEVVRQYEKMTHADFERMRAEKGLDAVSQFIRDAEYKRLGGY